MVSWWILNQYKRQETVFKKRDFSDIRFAELHDLLEINGETIHINRMEIRSTVLHYVRGRLLQF